MGASGSRRMMLPQCFGIDAFLIRRMRPTFHATCIMLSATILMTVVTLATPAPAPGPAPGSEPARPIPLNVIYLGTQNTPRAQAYEAFLKENFTSVRTVDRNTFDPSSVGSADVVLLDWSQSDVDLMQRKTLKSPLGPRENWTTPTVLLGSAGLLIAGPWQTNGSYGCTCLYPFAYNPRDHEVFNTPISIDRSHTIKRPAPNDEWRRDLGVEEVDVLPLVKDPNMEHQRGWCTYENTLAEGPEVEFICGGINDKMPAAVGIWRQGDLLHFGFDLSPDEMNDVAKALLINSIVYISHFTQDRPIVIAHSPFVDTSTRSRANVEKWLTHDEYPLTFFEGCIDKSLLASVEDRTREGYLAWFRANSKYLRPGPEGPLVWDDEAKSLDIQYNTTDLFEHGIPALRDPKSRQAATILLKRHAPEGPTSDEPDAWADWYRDNKPYLFYSEWGSYRWYIDPLAKNRGVPTSELHGPARADR